MGLVLTGLFYALLDGVFSKRYTGSSPLYHEYEGKRLIYYEQRASWAIKLCLLGFVVGLTFSYLVDSGFVYILIGDLQAAFIALVVSSSPGAHSAKILKSKGLILDDGEYKEMEISSHDVEDEAGFIGTLEADDDYQAGDKTR